jgi:hypothetical protein
VEGDRPASSANPWDWHFIRGEPVLLGPVGLGERPQTEVPGPRAGTWPGRWSGPGSARPGLKDLMLAVDAATDAGARLPGAPVLREIFEATVAEAGDEPGWAAIAEFTRRRSGP